MSGGPNKPGVQRSRPAYEFNPRTGIVGPPGSGVSPGIVQTMFSPITDALQSLKASVGNRGLTRIACQKLDRKYESMTDPTVTGSLAHAPVKRVEAIKDAYQIGDKLIGASYEGYLTAVYLASNLDQLKIIVTDCLKQAAWKQLQKRPTLEGMKTLVATALTSEAEIEETAGKVTRNVEAQIETMTYDTGASLSIGGLLTGLAFYFRKEATMAKVVKTTKVGWTAGGIAAMVVGLAKLNEATMASPEFHSEFKGKRDAWHAKNASPPAFDIQPQDFMSSQYVRDNFDL